MQFYSATIIDIEPPFKDVITLSFQFTKDDVDFHYNPGQHVVIQQSIDGQKFRQHFSLVSSPFVDQGMSVLMKRIKTNPVSEYFFEQAHIGQELYISEAYGFFYADINAVAVDAYYFIAEDQGIAPIYSMIKSILHAETISRVYLLYESYNRDHIIYENELTSLERNFPNRFSLYHTLSHASLLPRFKPWHGERGGIDGNKIKSKLLKHVDRFDRIVFFISTTGKKNISIQSLLMKNGVPRDRIRKLQYDLSSSNKELSNQSQSTELIIHPSKSRCTIGQSNTILQAMQQSNMKSPYACRSGICGTCAARLISGKVNMKNRIALEDADIESGWILTCQSYAQSEVIELEME